MAPSKINTPNPQTSGFTLIELLIVLLILTSLISLVGVNVLRHQGEAKIKTARIQISQLVSALKIYKLEQGQYPTTDQGLDALVRVPAQGAPTGQFPDEGYLDGPVVPEDPWGEPYVYLAPGRGGEPFEILSYGGDREPGGTGDDEDISSVQSR